MIRLPKMDSILGVKPVKKHEERNVLLSKLPKKRRLGKLEIENVPQEDDQFMKKSVRVVGEIFSQNINGDSIVQLNASAEEDRKNKKKYAPIQAKDLEMFKRGWKATNLKEVVLIADITHIRRHYNLTTKERKPRRLLRFGTALNEYRKKSKAGNVLLDVQTATLLKRGNANENNCFVPYEELPDEQKAKDHLFKAIVCSLASFIVNKPE